MRTRLDFKQYNQGYMENIATAWKPEKKCENCLFLKPATFMSKNQCFIGKFNVKLDSVCKHWRVK
jgi:hypothetical protein